MVQFTRPIWLLLLIPAVYYTWRLARHSLADLSRFRKRLALGLRLAIIVMLIFALAGVRMVRSVNETCVIFAMDVSDSIPTAKREQALAYVNRAVKKLKGNQKAGLIVFGGDASVELAPSNSGKIAKIYSVPSTSQTDISQALGLAVASFPENCRKKIVLLSDGNETMGKAIEQAMLAGSEDISVDVVPIAPDLPREALLDKMICPSNTKIGEPFDLKVVAVSKDPTVARIRLIRNGAQVAERTVDLAKGKSLLSFQQSVPKAGSYEYRAILETPDDTRPENNTALSYTMVRGKPKILYLEGKMDQARYLGNALKSSDIEVEVRNRSGVPNTLADLRGYDAIVMSDVPAWSMAPEQMRMVKSAVRDLGIGFTMVGGEASLGAGGYYDTPIEECLPVDMSIRKKKVLPSLSVVIIMDKSGSMSAPEGGRTKIELANDAAASVVSLLQPIDRIGIVVCHDYPVTAVPLTQANNKGPIYNQIQTIRAEGGGIYVNPSLKMAYQMLSGSPTRQKHVIVLADGADVDDGGPDTVSITKAMAAKKITVSCVAFGDGPSVPALKVSAAAGKGYYYLAKYARDLKAIFTKDVMTVSKTLFIEEPFVPKMDTSCPELSGIDPSSVPPLLGYIATSAKPAARLAAVSHKNDPILATWQYGLGKSAAFTSDCKARWSARWLGWGGYNKIWAQTVRSTMRKSAPSNFQTSVDIEGGVGRVTIDAVDETGNFLNLLKFSGSVVGPDQQGRPMTIDQTGPGRYESTFDARDVGSYVVNVVESQESKVQSPSGVDVNVMNIPYPPEYKDIEPNTSLLERLASETSGRLNPKPQDVFEGGFRPAKSYLDLWRLLALISILLLPLDIAVRRLSMNWEQVAELCAAVENAVRTHLHLRRQARKKAAERTETMESLLKVKKPRADHSEPPLKLDTQPTQRVFTAPAPGPTGRSEPPATRPASTTDAGVPKPDTEPADVTSRLLAAKRRAKQENKSD